MPRNLKGVVLISQTMGMGGAENFHTQLLLWFKKNNVPVRAWTTFPRLNRDLNSLGIKAGKIPLVVDIIGNWKGLIKGVLLFPAAFVYYGHLTYKNRKFGTFLLPGFSEKIFVTPWAKIFNVPVVWIEHGPLGSVFPKFFGFPKFVYHLVSKLPDFVVEPSNHTRRGNSRITGFDPAATRVISSGINGLVSRKTPQQRLTAYCVSRLEEGKGQDLLISAWPKVLKKFPKARLYLIGEGGFKLKLKQMVRKLDLARSVKFLGWVPDLATEVSPFSLGVFPSVWPLEGFGVVLLEAMSLGKPVICFDYGPYPEIVNRSCAIIVAKGNVEKLSDAIIRVFANPRLAKKLGKNGRARFNKLFTMDKIGPIYYETLLQAQTTHLRGNTDRRWQTYIQDLNNGGLAKFISDRIKKRRLTRKIYYLFKKPYIFIGKNKFYINKMDTVVSEWLMNKGIWEPFETEVFKKRLKGVGLVVDVGANIGYYTLLASRALKTNGRVIAFEPASVNFNLLERNVEENFLNNVKIEKKALGAKSGKTYVYLNDKNYGDSTTYETKEGRKKEKIAKITLDDYFSRSEDSIDLLKIDIQGSELKALRGAKKLLGKGRIKVIISELWPEGMKRAGDKWEEYISYLKLNGFNLFQINDEEKRLIPFSEKNTAKAFSEDKKYETNILAILKKK